MLELGFQKQSPLKFLLPSLISCVFVLLSQFSLVIVPRYFASFPLLAKLALSVLLLLAVAGFGRCCRRLLRVYTWAPALVFFNVLFIWGVYIVVVRQAIPALSDIVINAEFSVLMIGFYSILLSDPGVVTHESPCLDKPITNVVSEVKPHPEEEELSISGICHEHHNIEGSFSIRKAKYCKHCKAYIKGYDHHCPAFGNCIGQKNHALFMALLVGFIIAEASYMVCSTHFITKSQVMDNTGSETSLFSNLVTSTMLFSVLQVLWQVVFLVWHIYCICFNIKTDEWINWKKYPEFQLVVQCQRGDACVEVKFRNPYDKGIVGNIKEILALSNIKSWGMR